MIDTYSDMYNESVVIPTIKKKIRELRKETELTQKEFGSRAGIALITIQKWESNKDSSVPDVASLLRLCNTYHVDLDYFTGRLDAHDRDTDFVMEYTGLSEKAVLMLREMKQRRRFSTLVLDLLLQMEQKDARKRSASNDFAFFLESVACYFEDCQIKDLLSGYFSDDVVLCDMYGAPLPDPNPEEAETAISLQLSRISEKTDIEDYHIEKNFSKILDAVHGAFDSLRHVKWTAVLVNGENPHDLHIRRKDSIN